jgi:hypothetical protein
VRERGGVERERGEREEKQSTGRRKIHFYL